MDLNDIKNKILNNQITEEEINALLKKITPTRRKGTFMKTLVGGIVDGYTKPMILKLVIESILIFLIVVSVVILSYVGKIDTTVTMIMLAFVLGFLFGKIR